MNARNPAIKRITREWKEIEADNNDNYRAYPLQNEIFEWHFVIAGPTDTPFCDGLYHGRILLPPEYPFKPPSIIFLTPNGRFQTNTKICLSITGYHPEYWQPAWGIRTALMALISMLPQQDSSSLGSITCTPEDIKRFASQSISWMCSDCGQSNREVWDRGNNFSTETPESLIATAEASSEDLDSRLKTETLHQEPASTSHLFYCLLIIFFVIACVFYTYCI